MMANAAHIRRAVLDDVDALVEIAAERREQYRRYQPQFWRPADDAVQRQRDYFCSLLVDDQVAVLVASEGPAIRGFAIARTLSAPAVYSPGGLTCMVDDFTVSDPAEWPEVGPLLLDSVRQWGAERGAVQVVVVTAHLDEAKRAALQRAQLTLASEWWVGPTVSDPPP